MRFLMALCALVITAGTAVAQDARAVFRLDGGQPYVDVPFELEMLVEGFDEQPAPAQPKLVIRDAVVTPLGATPNVSRSIQIINGQRSDSVRVTWQMRWRIVATKAGRLQVPETTVTQGSKKATASAGETTIETVPTADDMKLTLELPARPIVVGESVPVTITWLFKRQPSNPTFSIPMLATDAFTATAPATTGAQQGRTISVPAGGKQLDLPYQIDQVDVGGDRWNRLQATFHVAPRKTGKLELAPATVVAGLAVGRPNFFGDAPTRMFRAADVPRTLEVKPLPEKDRPATFAGAVGDQYSIEVRTSRSVVSLGEPLELDVTIRSNQPLDTLSLGTLDGEGRLPKDLFTVPAEPPTGELSADGKTKTFKVVAQVTGPATEIPAFAFSYFDPTKSAYQTIHSEPIALSVKGGTLVGAGDVVSATPTKRPATANTTDDTAVLGADLALSSIGAVDDRPMSGSLLWILVGLLYAVPLLLLTGRTWQVRTRGQREEAAEVRVARGKVDELLAKAKDAPAREIAGPLGAALRDLARTLGRPVDPHSGAAARSSGAGPFDDDGLLARLETESFAPSAASKPLDDKLRTEAATLAKRWLADARRIRLPKATAHVAALAIVLLAPNADAAPLEDGRVAYEQAMEMQADATARKASFARAAAALGEAARAMPDRPELLADWGNAALGAGDVATATLAYRRALALDATNARAHKNLALVRSRQPELFRPAVTTGAADALLFFHAWPRSSKLLVGAGAFALAVLLLVPWSGRRRRALTGLAVLPAVVWLAMTISVITARGSTDDAIVMDDAVLRAADSAGAPAAIGQPVPRGAEVSVLERRDAWTRVRIANGTTGWLPSGAVERISR